MRTRLAHASQWVDVKSPPSEKFIELLITLGVRPSTILRRLESRLDVGVRIPFEADADIILFNRDLIIGKGASVFGAHID